MESKYLNIPSSEEIQIELDRVKEKDLKNKSIKNSISTLIVVAAISVLISTVFLQLFFVQGDSMNPTLSNNEVIIASKSKNIQRGDIISFSYNNKIMIKRVIALEGEIIDISENGIVYIDGRALDEPYIVDKFKGNTDIDYPYQVPVNSVFVMGDNRNDSIDSRLKVVGSIDKGQIIGKIFFRIWPMESIQHIGKEGDD